MRLVHSHDPCPEDRPLSQEEIQLAIQYAHDSMWGHAATGDFPLALVCERARDRMLDALSARLTRGAT